MAPSRVPAWLRRSFEAGLAAGAVAVVSLVGGKLSGTEVVVLPHGVPGALLLAPSVLALGVIPAAYPVALAATRSDALLGAVAAFLIAADAAALLAAGRLQVEGTGLELPAGFLTVLLAAAPAAAGIAAGQLATPLGFGRHAGAWSAAVAAIASLAALTGLALLVTPAA
jgi:hypothetical protein